MASRSGSGSRSGLGKPRPHSAKQIRERRGKIMLLMAKCYSQGDIARELELLE